MRRVSVTKRRVSDTLANSYPAKERTSRREQCTDPFLRLTEWRRRRSFRRLIPPSRTSNILGCFQDPCFIIIDVARCSTHILTCGRVYPSVLVFSHEEKRVLNFSCAVRHNLEASRPKDRREPMAHCITRDDMREREREDV